jgi:hypothetical protein
MSCKKSLTPWTRPARGDSVERMAWTAARVGADLLVLVPRHLEEDVAIPLAAFAHDVHIYASSGRDS